MSNGYSPKDIKKNNLAPIAGIVADQAISEDVGLTAGGSIRLRVDIVAVDVAVTGSITAKLQHRTPSGSFVDLAGANASVVISADGTYSLTQLVERAADQANIPIRKQLQVVVTTTDADDEVTISNIYIYQPL